MGKGQKNRVNQINNRKKRKKKATPASSDAIDSKGRRHAPHGILSVAEIMLYLEKRKN